MARRGPSQKLAAYMHKHHKSSVDLLVSRGGRPNGSCSDMVITDILSAQKQLWGGLTTCGNRDLSRGAVAKSTANVTNGKGTGKGTEHL